MASSYLLSLREGLEAALIIGIVLGALQKLDRKELKTHVWFGVAASVVLCLVISFLLNILKMEFTSTNQQIFEGVTMLLAAGVLTWMIFWMTRTAPNLKNELEQKTRNVLSTKTTSGIFLVAFFAVFREGVELSLFLLAVNTASNPILAALGAFLGLVSAVILGWALFSSAIKLDIKKFFQVTNLLLIVMAAGMVAYGVHELNEAGIIPAIIDPLWDINWLISDSGNVGSIFKALFGFNGNPSLTEVISYLVYFGTIVFFVRGQSTAKSS